MVVCIQKIPAAQARSGMGFYELGNEASAIFQDITFSIEAGWRWGVVVGCMI
jgi:hypothetical protein